MTRHIFQGLVLSDDERAQRQLARWGHRALLANKSKILCPGCGIVQPVTRIDNETATALLGCGHSRDLFKNTKPEVVSAANLTKMALSQTRKNQAAARAAKEIADKESPFFNA